MTLDSTPSKPSLWSMEDGSERRITRMKSKLKHWLIVAVIAIVVVILMSSCAKVESAEDSKKTASMFVEVENSFNWSVVYHRDTGVMYVVSCGGYNAGDFTMLVNADGTPMIYKGGDPDA